MAKDFTKNSLPIFPYYSNLRTFSCQYSKAIISSKIASLPNTVAVSFTRKKISFKFSRALKNTVFGKVQPLSVDLRVLFCVVMIFRRDTLFCITNDNHDIALTKLSPSMNNLLGRDMNFVFYKITLTTSFFFLDGSLDTMHAMYITVASSKPEL